MNQITVDVLLQISLFWWLWSFFKGTPDSFEFHQLRPNKALKTEIRSAGMSPILNSKQHKQFASFKCFLRPGTEQLDYYNLYPPVFSFGQLQRVIFMPAIVTE